MLVDTIRDRARDAMKSKDPITTGILRLALGEIQTVEARHGRPPTDEEAIAIVRKLVKSNEETLTLSEDDAQKATLREEIAVLTTLLPSTLGVAQIIEALAAVREAVRAAPNDGAATGVAMKHLKATGARADGKDVAQAVKTMRA